MSFFSAFYMDREDVSADHATEVVQSIHHNIGLILKTEAAFLQERDRELVNQSSICFGLEDIALFSRLNSGEQIAMRIKNKISQFEPRLHSIEVMYLAQDEEKHIANTMRFEISAVLSIKGKEELLQFDTDIDLTRLTVLIENESQYD
ncbi:type VI secretion system baseplate subunit TssE [Pseudoalteromonas sp. McH1-7]|uniref:Type VI secretion system protein ImpF n=1 Tax=Pseudoalteromonas peptidolytica F12-50-A1 TaxID=1315280 RepID=A0A8I0MRZ9_9GAMM|nr:MULTISPECIES: type VI secretion system baseplate subunit TssE [Pseudoalteromonas]MBE0344705.1 type VI secretion system protein ImpF [Pseudoalteromonas peptidolytica F12-50-A1]MDW7551245.1 type VI secretion system baseplate subunit TssE [Pseudoalteromonas peptidolytica]NLR14434.1 type VI secretion system baseplate subunit TssE [Pseudoalteromonas peptidolytica]NUZ12292.1 type VI secretion system baseplate subunit TssE [Pseudoalteromonas sp. McH1-7]RRS10381.1 type VI secretion system baseplate